MKINLGCGEDYRQGWDNIDISKEVKAEHYLDIRIDNLPYNENTVSKIYCSGVLCQILENEHLVHILNECHRVLEKNGEMSIIVPNSTHALTFRDPFDCRHFIPETFKYFQKDSHEYKLYGSVYGFKPWLIQSLDTNDSGITSITMKKP